MKSSLAPSALQRCVRAVPFVCAGLLILSGVPPAAAQGSAFSYQGQLSANGGPVNGLYDFRFKLYFDSFGNNQAGLAYLTNGATVANGLFSVSVDFGAGIFNGSNYLLEVDVKTNNADSYAVLSPLQAVAPVPYAIFASTASNLSGSLPAGQLSGVIPGTSLGGTYSAAVTFSNASGSFSGNGSGLTGVNAATLDGLTGGSFWQLGGNVATTPGTNYLGTADNQPLEFHVDAARALRIEPGGASAALGLGIPNGAPNIIGGSAFNFAAAGVVGATIGGGGATNYSGPGTNSGQAFANSVASDFGTIGGGDGNTIESNAFWSTIGGGSLNSIQANAGSATIAGGSGNQIEAGGSGSMSAGDSGSTIAGGLYNAIQFGAAFSTIAGGADNTIGGSDESLQDYSGACTIGGGQGNTIQSNISVCTISGGSGNTIQTGSVYSTIVGGSGNIIQRNSLYSTIGGGGDNSIEANAQLGSSTIAGGVQNAIQAAQYASIGGGIGNVIQSNDWDCTVGGGGANTILSNSQVSTISGGYGNVIQGNAGSSTIAGGWGNTVQGESGDSVIGGGYQNTINTNSGYCVIGGGIGNVVQASVGYAAIPGGESNIVGGSFALAAGCNAQALHQGAFVWADSQNAAFASTANDQFNVRAQGGVRFTSSAGGAAQTVSWSPGSGSWSFSSDRDLKDRFAPVNEGSILERVCKLPLAEWSYKGYDQRHIGAMAQDFHALFPLNDSDKSLNEMDLHGVELAAIKGLNQKLEQQNAAKDAEIRELRQSVAKLKSLVESLALR